MVGLVSPERFWGEAGQQEEEDERIEDREREQEGEESVPAKAIQLECAPCQQENEDLEPALQFFKMSSSKCYELKYLLEEDSKEGDEEGDLD